MRPFELVALAYFLALPVMVLATGGRTRPGGWLALGAGVAMALVVAAASQAPLALRAWLGHLYLVAGYWIPALTAAKPGTRFEAWLQAEDDRWRALLFAAPAWLTHAAELAYLLCYPLVPAAFLVVWFAGRPSDLDRFWLAVLVAGFACYGSLPWVAARPPRLLPGAGPRSPRVARLNAFVLSRVSHQLTTFPSGHVAVAVAAALAAGAASSAAGVVFGLIAIGISIGALTGRYHYVMDVATGIGVGLVSGILALVAVPGQGTSQTSEQRRMQMVEQDIAARGVSDPRVLEAMRTVRRERFVPPELAPRAYDDRPLPIGRGQTISQPFVVAYMSEVLETAPDHRVLEIGTGSGYQAAVLGELVNEVYTIEIVPELARRAAAALKEAGYGHVQVREGDGYAGWPERAPFDRILLTAAPETIPQPLLDQLAVGGRLVAPVGAQGQTQWIVIADKTPGGIVERRTIPVQFVPFTRSDQNDGR